MFNQTDQELLPEQLRAQLEGYEFLIERLLHQIKSYDKPFDAPAQLRNDLDFAENMVIDLRIRLNDKIK